jgi:di/tricarboxylate transporter
MGGMTLQIALLLCIIAVAVLLFTLERFPTDITALGLVLLLVITRLIPPELAFAGFGSDTVVMIFGLLVLTAALMRTGVVDSAGRFLLQVLDKKRDAVLIILMVTAAILSAFISNTATAALFVPITLGLTRRLQLSSSKLLMPLAFAAILASSVTLVASSTNIVVSGVMTHYGLPPLGMFELTLVGIPIAIIGILYMVFIGQRIIPDRSGLPESDEQFGIRPYMAEVVVLPDSPIAGKTLAEAALGRDLDLTVLRVVRDKNRYLVPQATLRLKEDDELLVKGQRSDVLKIRDTVGLAFKADVKLSDPRLQLEDVKLVEVILLPRSPLTGRTLKTLRFRERYGLQVLGVNRRGKSIFKKLSQTRLRTGDQLLIQGPRANIAALDQDNFHVLGTVEHKRPNLQRAPIAISIFAGVLLLAALNILSLPVSVLLGTLGVFITRCITPDEAYREVEWKAIIVIGSMLALGSAMEYTGTADYIAGIITGATLRVSPVGLLTLFFGLTLLLTQPMSNQAAAVLVLPVALQSAIQLGLNPRSFAVMIALGASCSFITPLEPACLIVYGPGHYKFMDFVKVGSVMTVLVYLVAIIMVPWLWPLKI